MQDKKIEETSAPKKLTIKEIARRYLQKCRYLRQKKKVSAKRKKKGKN